MGVDDKALYIGNIIKTYIQDMYVLFFYLSIFHEIFFYQNSVVQLSSSSSSVLCLVLLFDDDLLELALEVLFLMTSPNSSTSSLKFSSSFVLELEMWSWVVTPSGLSLWLKA